MSGVGKEGNKEKEDILKVNKHVEIPWMQEVMSASVTACVIKTKNAVGERVRTENKNASRCTPPASSPPPVVCVFFALNCSFYSSTSSTPSVRADSSS